MTIIGASIAVTLFGGHEFFRVVSLIVFFCSAPYRESPNPTEWTLHEQADLSRRSGRSRYRS